MGKVRKNSLTTAKFRVDNVQELQRIINHFNNYPLVSDKFSDFLLFKECFNLIKQKKHLTQDGFEQILALKYNLNKGLSDELKNAFPCIVPVNRPKYRFKGIPNPFWLAGFVSGDSTFSVSIEKGNTKLGKRVRLIFGTNLHIRDKELLIGIANYFKYLKFNSCFSDNQIEDQLYIDRGERPHRRVYVGGSAGVKVINVHTSKNNNNALLQIKNNFYIQNKVIPFFEK